MGIDITKLKKEPRMRRILDIGFVKKIRIFRVRVRNLVEHKNVYDLKWKFSQNGKAVYLGNAKVATVSITASLLGVDGADSYTPVKKMWEWGMVSGKLKNPSSYYKFSFVRNPFSRLVSCYESKYHNDRQYHHIDKKKMRFYKYLCGYLRKDEGFDIFIKKIVRIPYWLMDYHFRLQSDILFDNKGRCRVDYVGKFENIQEEFSEIARIYDLTPLPHYNKAPLEIRKKLEGLLHSRNDGTSLEKI